MQKDIHTDSFDNMISYYSGTVAGYITTAIQEKMERDGIL